MKRFWMTAAVWLVVAAAATAEPIKPAVEVRIKPVAELAPLLEYGGELFGQADAGKQFAGILKTFADNKEGYEGLDLTRPIGAYVGVADNVEDSPVVLLLPVLNEDAVLAALKDKIGIEPKKEKGDFYSVDVPNVPGPIFFRFAERYAYLTLRSEKGIDPAKLIAPKDFFSGKPDGLLSASVYLDRWPADVKKSIYGQLELQLKENNSKLAASPAQKLANDFLADLSVDAAKTVLTDGDKLTVSIDIDPKADDWKLSVGLTPKAGTTLEKTLAGFADRDSAAAGVGLAKNAVMSAAVNFVFPPETKEKLGKLADALVKQATENAKDADQAGIKLVTDALIPTLKSGDVQLGFAIPDAGGKPGLAVAVRTAKGTEIEKVAKLLGVLIPAKQGQFEGDVDSVGERKVHKITLGSETKAPFASNTLWVLTSDDLLAVTADAKSDGLKAVPTAAKKVPMLAAEVSFTRVMPLADSANADKAAKVAKDVFDGKADGRDTLKVTATGGKKFDLTVSMKGKAIAFLMALDKAKKE